MLFERIVFASTFLWLYCQRIDYAWSVKLGMWSVKTQRICFTLFGGNPDKVAKSTVN